MSRLTYKKAQDELSGILEKFERNEVEIDDLNKTLKRASELIKFCRNKLRETEEAVNELSEGLNDI